MELKNDLHIFAGMQRDVDIAKHKPEYLYDAYNIRIDSREDNTLLGITNEKGPELINSFSGKYVGHIVVENEYIILFLHNANIIKREVEGSIYYTSTNSPAVPLNNETRLTGKDVIIKINKETTRENPLYEFLFIGNLNFDINHTIQGIYRYESSEIRKIYWVDGLNQPRMINIMKQWDSVEDDDTISTRFDFIQTLTLQEEISVEKGIGGTFSPGVIQYAFSYYYLNGQESNLFYVTPLYYIGKENTKSVSPEGASNSAFNITISNYENKFDYIRIYSIHRTSENSVGEYKIVKDINIKDKTGTLEYTDYGNSGSSIGAMDLYYIGGEVITPDTICYKDATLFLANFKYNLNILRGSTLSFTSQCIEADLDSTIPKFRGGEHYLFGIQVQDKYGIWSDPYLLEEQTISDTQVLNKVEYTVDGLPSNAVKARGVCVLPTLQQRNIIASGVINPVLYQNNQSIINEHTIFQSSWFFRPQHEAGLPGYHFEHNESIYGTHLYSDNPSIDVEIEGGGRGSSDTDFIISYNVVDLYSPDAEFDTLSFTDNNSINVKYIGDVQILTYGTGILNIVALHQLNLKAASDGMSPVGRVIVDNGIIDHYFEYEEKIDNNGNTETIQKYYYIFPWTSSGSFTEPSHKAVTLDTDDDTVDNLEVTFNHLRHNRLLRWIDGNTIFSDSPEELITGSYKQYYKENENISLGLNGNYYLGQIDTVLRTPAVGKKYKTSKSSSTWISDFQERRLIEMKYKTCTHLVIDLTKPLYFNDINKSVYDLDGRDQVTVNGFYKSSTLTKPESIASEIVELYLEDVYKNLHIDGTGTNAYIDPNGQLKVKDYFKYIIACDKDNRMYLFAVRFQTKNDGTIVVGLTLVRQTGTINNKYFSYSYDTPNLILGCYNDSGVWGYPDGNGGWATSPQHFSYESEDISGDYYLKDGYIYKYIPDPVSEDPEEDNNYVQVPEAIEQSNRLVLVDIINSTPVPLNDDVSWVPASTQSSDVEEGETTITFDIGDTWVQDYYCMKTFPFTTDDENQITEIIKFKCPTRVNLMGRYSEIDSPPGIPILKQENFNKVNKVYSNQNNFFTYSKPKEQDTIIDDISNSMTWCKEGPPNAEIDFNTSVSLLNAYAFDEKITTLITNKSNFYAFHPSSISKISFNPRVEVSPSDNIPIELSTSKKMYGADTLVDYAGSSNRNHIIRTDVGIFFVDDLKRILYLLDEKEGLSSISTTKNFKDWFSEQSWLKDSKLFYDFSHKDLYLVGDYCLVFNAYLQEFVSFLSYEMVPSMFNVDNGFYCFNWYYNNNVLDDNYTSLYRMFTGEYNTFFGFAKPVYISFISAQDSALDKIFTGVETRTDVWVNNELEHKHFDYIQATNEYQDTGQVSISTTPWNRSFTSTTSKKKFRVWNIDMPRHSGSLDRIRNTWTNIKLGFAPNDSINPATVVNLTGATNPNIAMYYAGMDGSNILEANVEQRQANLAPSIGESPNAHYANMKILIHDINVKYLV